MLTETLDQKTYENLVTVAYRKSKPFCYSCCKEVKEKNCSSCSSDDNMRLLDGVGVEYGIEWVIEHLVSENCAPIDDEYAKESLTSCYEETVKIGWIEYDMMSAIEILDPISYRIALDEYMESLRADGEIVEVDGDDYWVSDIERFVELNLEEAA